MRSVWQELLKIPLYIAAIESFAFAQQHSNHDDYTYISDIHLSRGIRNVKLNTETSKQGVIACASKSLHHGQWDHVSPRQDGHDGPLPGTFSFRCLPATGRPQLLRLPGEALHLLSSLQSRQMAPSYGLVPRYSHSELEIPLVGRRVHASVCCNGNRTDEYFIRSCPLLQGWSGFERLSAAHGTQRRGVRALLRFVLSTGRLGTTGVCKHLRIALRGGWLPAVNGRLWLRPPRAGSTAEARRPVYLWQNVWDNHALHCWTPRGAPQRD